METAVLLGAVVVAVSLMAGYIRGSMRASVKLTEVQLNGAMADNRP